MHDRADMCINCGGGVSVAEVPIANGIKPRWDKDFLHTLNEAKHHAWMAIKARDL
jgi:hypothetical protein